jgi:hypothetical protein
MVLATNNKYTLPLLLTMLALIKEPTKASKVSKVPILRTIKLKKPASKID